MRKPGWLPDPADPRAPSREVWATLTPEQRAAVVAALPAEVPLDLHPPEGDLHRIPKDNARDSLDGYFRTTGRRVYVSSEVATYYPGEPMFCPDVLVVLDAETHPRQRWAVEVEGRGLDFILEIHVSGDRTKDFERNVSRYARLGVPEYFVLDREALRLHGYRLPPGGQSFDRIMPQAGRFRSNVLGLDLSVERGLVRFFHGTAPLLFAEEVVARLNATVTEVFDARDAEARRAEQADARLEEERAKAKAERATAKAKLKAEKALSDARIRELEAELERLRKR